MHNKITVGNAQFTPEQIVGALSPHVLPERLTRLREVLGRRLNSVALGLEDLFQSHNGVACLRTAEGLGLQQIVTAEIRNTFQDQPEQVRLNHRVTTSAHNWVTLNRVTSSEALMDWAKARDMRVFGAGPRADHTLESLPVDRPVMLLFGNEAEGLKPETMSACDGCFRIPMYGFVESFNVSVSVGMALNAVAQRRRKVLADAGIEGDLPPEEQGRLLAEWLLRDVRAADKIVARKLGTGGAA